MKTRQESNSPPAQVPVRITSTSYSEHRFAAIPDQLESSKCLGWCKVNGVSKIPQSVLIS